MSTDALQSELLARIYAADTLDALEAVRLAALGKAGQITQLMKSLGGLQPEERLAVAPAYQALRETVSAALEARKADLGRAALTARLEAERIDMSLPPAPPLAGSVHPISQVMDELSEIFADLGFAVAEGPEIESDWHNFTALNIPPEHPARAMHDTFYATPAEGGERMVLRTHTSPVQIRTMMAEKPPIRIIAPGRVYRSDSDATHTPMFHQVEGLVIDRGIHLGHLKWTLETFVKAFFEVDDVTLRLRPSYFPFTEPGVEVDVGCSWENGTLKIGGTSSWMEILGAGMVHRRVLENCGLDPAEWQGFAFGCGIDRLAMLKYGMTDLRAFFDADLRWLKHFGFASLDVPTLSAGVGA
ncbi:phenylalanine--tRNA ligase subunit alpha [Sandaracinobacter neustonicus]|uniref:Phenylalanine--tRNA ligase alpha subunit n=1 Tax=Sandaracinobacter neustonicus TaxID=1715348 RepID=A0A501XED7_9SPHN|nr:phenylalanine--tRNA ligase subunit alpha [Sandaracinobacter neustonicus]TPE58663.1 phenylalanine--tRNA ligase subunit alpha [Sandaracinobacter neustonicus]